MKLATLIFLFSFSALAAFSESDIVETLENQLIPDYFTTQTQYQVNIYGTLYDMIVFYKDRGGAIVARKGVVSQGTGDYQQITYYQNGVGRNVYRIGYMFNITQFGTQYNQLVFFQNHIGKNLAILSYSGAKIFYQNGIFRNIAARDGQNFLDGSLRPISRSDFSLLFKQFMDLVLDF